MRRAADVEQRSTVHFCWCRAGEEFRFRPLPSGSEHRQNAQAEHFKGNGHTLSNIWRRRRNRPSARKNTNKSRLSFSLRGCEVTPATVDRKLIVMGRVRAAIAFLCFATRSLPLLRSTDMSECVFVALNLCMHWVCVRCDCARFFWVMRQESYYCVL